MPGENVFTIAATFATISVTKAMRTSSSSQTGVFALNGSARGIVRCSGAQPSSSSDYHYLNEQWSVRGIGEKQQLLLAVFP
ncbi:hypothetical protein [Ktedonobacter racemifer]|uniref:hypothetical protein n=1 Tax=Ktedonobacter racemifer TaxID=363277 RepID=UPI0012F8C518|nr:hypothetical protein [Ktedonobacter racemifer]